MKAKIKICTCGHEMGAKTRTCKKCGHKFSFEKKKEYQEVREWQKLKPGNIIHLRKGAGGPIYRSDDGEKYKFGYRGRFTVMSVQNDGILAYSSNTGSAFLYMGPEQESKLIPGLLKKKHKIHKKI